MQPFKWIVPCAGGPGESGGGRRAGVGGRAHSWIEPLTSNSPTTECCVSHTPRSLRVSNQVCEKGWGGVRKKSTTCFSLFSFLSEFGSSVGQALVKFSMPPPPFPTPTFPSSLSLTHTQCLFVSPTTPPPHPLSFLFFPIPLYIRLFVLGKRTPTSVEGGWLEEGGGGVGAFFFFFQL